MTEEEKKAKKHKRYLKNREKTLIKKKIYYQKHKEAIKEKQKERYAENRETILEENRKHYHENSKQILETKKKYTEKNKENKKAYDKTYSVKNSEKKKVYNQLYREQNRERLIEREKEYRKNKYRNDPIYKIKENCRRRILSVLKDVNLVKSKRTEELVGCKIEFLKKYLEERFQNNMSWENHGRKGWHIDHIRPCSSFDLSNPEEQKKCFHYINLQPLWWYENLSKGARL